MIISLCFICFHSKLVSKFLLRFKILTSRTTILSDKIITRVLTLTVTLVEMLPNVHYLLALKFWERIIMSGLNITDTWFRPSPLSRVF